MLKGYNRKNGANRCAMKIDIQKAYDIVDWSFLRHILAQFRFHSKIIQWVMICISTTLFSICINGERYGIFKGGRGLRQ